MTETSKAYLGDIKVKCGLGADGRYFVWLESGTFGTIMEEGATMAEAIAKVIEGCAGIANSEPTP
jgi:hypothetical protein